MLFGPGLPSVMAGGAMVVEIGALETVKLTVRAEGAAV